MAKKTKPPSEQVPVIHTPKDDGPIIDQLTPKERLFVKYYCGSCGFNGTRAAIRAGYTENSAATLACEYLRKPHIMQAVEEELERRALDDDELNKAIITEYCKIAFANVTNAAQFNRMLVAVQNGEELPLEVSAAIKSVTMTDSGTKIEFHDKKGCLDSLARIKGMFTDNFRAVGVEHENVVERLYKKRMAEKEAKGYSE